MQIDMRPNRALEILSKQDQVKRIDANTYKVKSQSGHGYYQVLKIGEEWKCECQDYLKRGTTCKHIYSILFSQTLRQQIASEPLGLQLDEKPDNCLYCGSSAVLKRGFAHEKGKKVQRFWCKDCNKTFVLNYGFRGMKNDPKIITIALDAYFRGMSLRDTRDHLLMFHGVRVHYVTILRWVGKYTKVISGYVDSLQPIVGDTWHIDEMTLDVNGKKEWLWNVMDDDTRFLLASKISKRRDVADARKPLREARERAAVRPRYVVSDGLKAYPEAITKEFYTMANPKTKHVRLPSIREHPNNNLVERLHGTIRERNKVQRGLKEGATTNIADGHRIFYNFLRGHMGIEGERTPAEKAGIKLRLEGNKWMELIKQATKPCTMDATPITT